LLTLAWQTDPGLQRQENEDSVLVWENKAGVDALLIVCDGMGGHAAGREASSIAIQTMASTLEDDGTRGASRLRLLKAFDAANQAVLHSARTVPEWAGMGSTLTAVLISGEHLALINVGDSPGYVIRDRQVFPVAQDHSWPAEQFRAGLIDASEVRDHPFKHRLTRAIGVWDDVLPYTAEVDLEDGDVVVLASDGVESAGVEVETVRELLGGDDLAGGIAQLVDLCRTLGGPDNITVAAARYVREEVAATVPPVAPTVPPEKTSALDRASRRRQKKA
jgi:protein phosphatase